MNAEGASVSVQALPAAKAGSKDDVMHLKAGAPSARTRVPATPTHLLGSPRSTCDPPGKEGGQKLTSDRWSSTLDGNILETANALRQIVKGNRTGNRNLKSSSMGMSLVQTYR